MFSRRRPHPAWEEAHFTPSLADVGPGKKRREAWTVCSEKPPCGGLDLAPSDGGLLELGQRRVCVDFAFLRELFLLQPIDDDARLASRLAEGVVELLAREARDGVELLLQEGLDFLLRLASG